MGTGVGPGVGAADGDGVGAGVGGVGAAVGAGLGAGVGLLDGASRRARSVPRTYCEDTKSAWSLDYAAPGPGKQKELHCA